MSSSPPETETYEVTLSRDEQWVVHAVLAEHIDDALDDDETPPAWALELFDAIDTGNGLDVLTGYQARRLVDVIDAHVAGDDVPEQDLVHGSNVLERLETQIEA